MRIKEHEKERRQTHKKQEENARGQTGARKSEKKQDDVTEVEDVNTRWKEKIERRRREKNCRNLKMNSTRKTPFVGNVCCGGKELGGFGSKMAATQAKQKAKPYNASTHPRS